MAIKSTQLRVIARIASLLQEKSNRLPEEDYVTVMSGILGAYPDALWQVEAKSLDDFVTRIINLNIEKDYRELMYLYGIRRSHAKFWNFSDQLHQFFQSYDSIEYGLLDFNRIENQ